MRNYVTRLTKNRPTFTNSFDFLSHIVSFKKISEKIAASLQLNFDC